MLATTLDDIRTATGIELPQGTLGSNIAKAFPYFFGIVGIILVLNIIVSGYQMMTSAGEPKVIQVAQAKITTSLIGIVIILISFWVVQIIGSFFGISIFEQLFGNNSGGYQKGPI